MSDHVEFLVCLYHAKGLWRKAKKYCYFNVMKKIVRKKIEKKKKLISLNIKSLGGEK